MQLQFALSQCHFGLLQVGDVVADDDDDVGLIRFATVQCPVAGDVKQGAVLAAVHQFTVPVALLHQCILDLWQRLGKRGSQQFVRILPNRLLLVVAVQALGADAPEDDPPVSVAYHALCQPKGAGEPIQVQLVGCDPP